MQETLDDIVDEVLRSWPFRWQGLMFAWAAAVIAAIFVILMPDVYEVTAKVAIQTDSRGNISAQAHDAETQFLSDSLLTSIVNKVDFGAPIASEAAREEAKRALKSRISLSGYDTSSFSIRYRDTEPARAQAVSKLLLAGFEDSIDLSNSSQAQARTTAQTQLVDRQAALDAANKKIDDFRRAHLDVFGQGGIESRLDSTRATLDKSRADYRAAVSTRDQLQDEWRNASDSAQVTSTADALPVSDPLVTRLNTLFAQLQNLRAQYSDSHPDVVVARRQIQLIVVQYPPDVRMCTRSAKSSSANVVRPATVGLDAAGEPTDLTVAEPIKPTPKINQATINVVSANISVCRAESSLSQAETDFSGVSSIAARAFPIEQQLAKLEANRDSISSEVDDLKKRLGNWQLVKASDLYMIEQAPIMPIAPASPNRRLWLVAVTLGALAGGVLVTYVCNLIAGTFIRPGEIERAFRLPYYGSVSQVSGLKASLDQSASALSFMVASGALLALMLFLVFSDPFIPAARHWASGVVGSLTTDAEPSK